MGLKIICNRETLSATFDIVTISILLSSIVSNTTYYLIWGIDDSFFYQTVFAAVIPAICSFPIGLYVISQTKEVERLNADLKASQKKAETLVEKLTYDSSHDAMTGLFNRAYFFEKITVRKTLSKKDALLMIDVDHFKKVNDKYGHHVGDKALKAISAALSEALQGTSAIHSDLARVGGEEFAVLLDQANIETATKVAEIIRQKVERLNFMPHSGVFHKLTVSIGVALLEGVDAEYPLRKVGVALYDAKQQGRNRVCVYQSEIHEPKHLRPQLMA